MKIFSSLLCLLVITSESYSQVAPDTSFIQEHHEPMPVSAVAAENDIRKVAIDKAGTVWIATPAGVLSKSAAAAGWKSILKKG